MLPRLLFFGSSEFGLPALESLLMAKNIELVGVVTQPPRPKGRGGELEATPVGRWADEQRIPALLLSTLRDDQAIAQLKSPPADLFLVAAFGLILPSAALMLPPRGSINIHASLLPQYRGASPIAAAIADGQPDTGITFMLMDEGIDTGPMLRQYSIPLAPEETAVTLHRRLQQLAAEHVVQTVGDWLAGSLVVQSQPASGATTAPKITKDDGHTTWDSAAAWERKIRAYAPWPGVWAQWGERLIKFLAAKSIPGQPSSAPGTIEAYDQKPGWRVASTDGWLVPGRVQFSDKKPQLAETIVGSYPGFIGSRLT